MNTVELQDKIGGLEVEARAMLASAQSESRMLTDEEQAHFNDITTEIRTCREDLDRLEQELAHAEQENTNTNINSRDMAKNLLTTEIRKAMESQNKTFTINAETRTMTVQGQDGIHDQAIETEIQGILEPLYANSVLADLGVRFYPGLPHGDVQIPIMGKSNVGWAGEVSPASATGNSFSAVKLTPKRLTAYIDISKQLLVQDTIGVEAAIRRDIVNALNDKLEATILDANNKTDNRPIGIFYDQTLTSVTSFADLCALEAGVEHQNFNGQMKYLLSTGAKAALRAMAKGSKSTQLVLEGGEVDGTPIVVTSNVADNKLVYGDFSNIVVGSWGDIELTVDEYTQAVNGCVRLVINAFFDAAITRPEGLAFGQTA